MPPDNPATLSGLADKSAATFVDLDREVDGYFEVLRKLDPELAERAVARADGSSLAAFLLLCPSSELGASPPSSCGPLGNGRKCKGFMLSTEQE